MKDICMFEAYYDSTPGDDKSDLVKETKYTKAICKHTTKGSIDYSRIPIVESFLRADLGLDDDDDIVVIPVMDFTKDLQLQSEFHIDAIAQIIHHNQRYILPIDFKFREACKDGEGKLIVPRAVCYRRGEYHKDYGILEKVSEKYADLSSAKHILLDLFRNTKYPLIFTNISDDVIALLPHMTMVLVVMNKDTNDISDSMHTSYSSEKLYVYAKQNKLSKTTPDVLYLEKAAWLPKYSKDPSVLSRAKKEWSSKEGKYLANIMIIDHPSCVSQCAYDNIDNL